MKKQIKQRCVSDKPKAVKAWAIADKRLPFYLTYGCGIHPAVFSNRKTAVEQLKTYKLNYRHTKVIPILLTPIKKK